MLACDKCGAGIPTDARFCPQCGDPVTEADKASPAAKAHAVANVEIGFGYSSSPNYQKAVDICAKLPSYQLSGEEKESVHKINLPITEVDLLANLYDLVGSWKSSQMLINGCAATKKELTYYGVGCYRTRQKAYRPDQYCFGEKDYEANIWGCTRLNMPIFEWGGGWLEYGQFDQAGAWHFDKPRIRHELEVAIKDNELCPMLDRTKVLATLDRLPESIDPKTNKSWAYRTQYEESGGEYEKVAVGIKPLLKKMNRYVLGDYKPTWETANGAEGATDGVDKVEPSQSNTAVSGQRPPRTKSNAIWWILGGIFLLYLLWR